MVDISSGQQKLLRERNPENSVSSGYWTQKNNNKSVDKSSVTFHKYVPHQAAIHWLEN